jgi:hypothetical protein
MGTAARAQQDSQQLSAIGGMNFISGLNYPWNNCGWDFGAAWGHAGVSSAASRSKISGDFAYMHSKGVKVVRWFMMGDGRADPKFDSNGMVTGFDDYFYPDVDAALSIAQANGIKLIFVLFDFNMLANAQTVNGVQLGGHAGIVANQSVTTSLLNNALVPLFKRYGQNPAILAWEIINEPENRFDAVSYSQVYSFAKQVAEAVHANTSQLVTLGSARREYVTQWQGLGLDFYEFHYYEQMPLSYASSLSPCKLDKPCVLGEYQTKNASRPITDYLDTALNNGFGGAFPWSLDAQDNYSAFTSFADDYSAWAQAHR